MFLRFVLLSLLLASSAFGSLFQTWSDFEHATSSATQTLNVSSNVNVQAGDLLIVMIGTSAQFRGGNPNPVISPPTSAAVASFTKIFDLYCSSMDPTPSGIAMYAGIVTSGGAIATVSVSVSTTRDIDMIVHEYSGLGSSATASNSAEAESSSLTTVQPGAISPSAGQQVVAFSYDTNDSHSWTVDSGFALEAATANTGGETLQSADRSAPGGSLNPTFTSPIASVNIPMYAGIVSFGSSASSLSVFMGITR